MKKIIYIVIILLIIFGAFLAWQYCQRKNETPLPNPPQEPVVNSFEECKKAGYPIMESYPAQCKTPDGKFFTEDIGNALEKEELIIVISPRPNEIIKSPLKISGQARGNWFFEAEFPIKLLDGNGNQIASGIAWAKEDWMTTESVPFEAEIEFQIPGTNKGNLILEKNNPSDLPENSDELRIPIKFSE